MTLSWTARFARQDRASAMIEFAIVLPLLFLLAFGVIDFGRAFYVYNALSSVVRDGARFGAGQPCGIANDVVTTRVQQRLVGTAPPGTVVTDGVLMDYLGAAQAPTVSVTFPVPDGVRVQISNYTYRPWTPIIPQAKALTFTVSAIFRRELVPPCT